MTHHITPSDDVSELCKRFFVWIEENQSTCIKTNGKHNALNWTMNCECAICSLSKATATFDLLRGYFRELGWGFCFTCLFLDQITKQKTRLHILEREYTYVNVFVWFCKVGHLADEKKPGSECRLHRSIAGPERTVTGQTECGTWLLSHNGQCEL